MDFAAAGLLDGLDEPERQARLTLLNRLERDGATPEELIAAVREERLALLLVERRLGGRHTALEIERETGMPAEVMLRMRRLLGLPAAAPEDRVFSDEDVGLARSTKLFLDAGFELETLAELTRVLGESMSRVAAAVVAGFAETFLRAGDTERDVAERFDTLAEQLTPALSPVLLAAFNAHLRESVHRGMIGRAQLERGQPGVSTDLCVCFADLVGFTRLGGEIEVHELGSVAGHLAELAGDVAVPPVRLIKTIGDAAMFVSPEAEPLVSAALQLVAAVKEAEMPSLRAGIAFGPAAQRAGDFFGHSVNLASRVTGVARPGSVLCTEEVHDLAADAFDWSYAGRFKLKGIADAVPLHRPHARPGPETADPETAGGETAGGETPAAEAADGDGRSATSRRAGRRRRSTSR
jgi:adenylate cyclase